MFLYFIQTGEMMIPVDSDKLYIKNVMPRATTKKVTQRDTLKNITDKSKWNFLNVQSNPQAHRKKKTEKQTTEIKWKTMTELSSNISIIILNINGLSIPIKRGGRNRLTNMTQLHAVNKKLISSTTT